MKTKSLLCLLLVLLLSQIPLFAQIDLGGGELPDGITVEKDIPYVNGGKYRQQLNLFFPPGYKEADHLFPVIIAVHGGSWSSGSKDEYGLFANWFTPKGYIVALINYRLIDKAKDPADVAPFPAQIEDCKSVVRWLRANAKKYKIDPNRIGAWGASAGGHLVALLATTDNIKDFDVGENLDQSTRLQAVCDFFGPTDFVALLEDPKNQEKLEELGKQYNVDVNGTIKKMFGPNVKDMDELKEHLKKASPMSYIHKDCPPILILHGDKDELVPFKQSVLFEKALKDAGVDAELWRVKGATHVDVSFLLPANMKKVEDFFAKHLKPGK
ncbi:MAG: alpha/beta hydrolase fold domain-containing protein [Thermoguttaceae bacterium]